MLENKEKRRELAKWIIGVFTACILIYLGIRHIDAVASAIVWLVDLVKPLLMGLIIALILNVPMRSIENGLLRKMKKGRRALSILLSLLLVIGIFVLVAVLVVPELVNAIVLVIQIVMESLDVLAGLDAADYAQIPFLEKLIEVNIDWSALKLQLEQWMQSLDSDVVTLAVDAIGSVVGGVIRFFVAVVFAIYILGRKKTLKRQVKRLIRAWLPKKFGTTMIHIADVGMSSFRQFISGQAIEAMILGTLCTIGMLILRLPYAGMIGALVGVTALVPVVGAYTGGIVGFIMILTVEPIKAVIFVVFLVILQQSENNLIYPRVVGHRINLPAIWVLSAVTIGGGLAGPIGMLLGVPLASAAYALIREATEAREKKKAQIQSGD